MSSEVAPIHPINTIITPGAINVTTTAAVGVASSIASSNDSSNSTVSHIHPIRTYITPQGSDGVSNKQKSDGGSASGLASATAASGSATSGNAAAADSTKATKTNEKAASSASPASSAPSKANGGVSLTVAGTVVMVGFAALLF